MKVRFIEFDWKGRPEPSDLEEAVEQVFEGKPAGFNYVPDTDSDSFVLIIASDRFSEDDAQRMWNDYLGNRRMQKNPDNSPLEKAYNYPFGK